MHDCIPWMDTGFKLMIFETHAASPLTLSGFAVESLLGKEDIRTFTRWKCSKASAKTQAQGSSILLT